MLVADFIKQKNIEAEIITLDTPFPTTKHIARYFGITERQIFLSQLLQGENKRLIMCIYSAKDLLDFKKIEEVSSIKRLRYADREVVQKTTGYEVGSIPLVGFEGEFPIFIDEKIFEQESGYGSAGSLTSLMKIMTKDIENHLEAQTVLITK